MARREYSRPDIGRLHKERWLARQKKEEFLAKLEDGLRERLSSYPVTIEVDAACTQGLNRGRCSACLKRALAYWQMDIKAYYREVLKSRKKAPFDYVLAERPASQFQVAEIDVALTGCAAAIAETGTVVLDGRQASGRRALTLVPDHHVCVVPAEQVYGGVPEGLAAVAAAVASEGAPITMISGPSATSDIELERVEGVHGPRHLLVLIIR